MKITSTNRRPILAVIAGSALLLAGAAMPNICLHNPTLLYALGQAKFALGDQEGGLRLIASASQQNDSSDVSAPAKPQAAKVAATSKPACTVASAAKPVMVSTNAAPKAAPAIEPVTVNKRFVVFHEPRAHQDKFVQLARLDRETFKGLPFDQAAFVAQLEGAAREREQVRAADLQATLSRVKADLERRGIAVPATLGVTVPEPPVPPVTNP